MTEGNPFPQGSTESAVLSAVLQVLQQSGPTDLEAMVSLWRDFVEQVQLPVPVQKAVWPVLQEHFQRMARTTAPEPEPDLNAEEGTPAPSSPLPPDPAPVELTPPRLHIDLGQAIAVGNALEIEFHLLCPGYIKRPKVTAELSGTLDRKNWDPEPRIYQEEPGYWTFRQTCALRDPDDPGKKCAPGSYRIDLECSFPHAPVGSLGRELRASLRFSVPDPEKTASTTLEIDGDGLSIINLAGLDMTNFGKVVISGSDQSIIRMNPGAESTAPMAGKQNADNRYFQLPLKRHYERDEGRVFASPRVAPATLPATRIALRFDGGGRYLVYAQDRLQFGRQRSERNDIILRFVPGSSRGQRPEYRSHEEQGEALSREHFALALSRDGLTATDLGSRAGTTLGGSDLPPQSPVLITPRTAGSSVEIHAAEVFRLHASIFAAAIGLEHPEPGKEHVEAVGASQKPTLWTLSGRAGIDAARIRRVTNLPGEQYVMLFRQLFIGSSDADCAVITPVDTGFDRMARLLALGDGFWFERLVDPFECAIEVDGHEPQLGELVPVQPGQRWRFGGSVCHIEPLAQDLSGY